MISTTETFHLDDIDPNIREAIIAIAKKQGTHVFVCPTCGGTIEVVAGTVNDLERLRVSCPKCSLRWEIKIKIRPV